MDSSSCAHVRGEKIPMLRRWSAACSAIHVMSRSTARTHIERTSEDDRNAAWLDEKTVRFDFDKPTLTADDRLVIGYLTMEANDLFGHLSVEEQLAVAVTLKR